MNPPHPLFPKTVLVTGGAGFIGSALIRTLVNETPMRVVNFDKLTYAACLANLAEVEDNPNYCFVKGDIANTSDVEAVFRLHQPDVVIHLAAESHVDRSIEGPDIFVRTNIQGTATLLQAALQHWQQSGKPSGFRFLHVSTDEIYGSLGPSGRFTEDSPVRPSSPYSASKASADLLVRAWRTTYGLPTLITNCSNNYGPYQFPEKLIPLMILKALAGETLPIYGSGEQVRDWLHVDDHARALWCVATQGQPGREYLVGGECERSNLTVVNTLCAILDERFPDAQHTPHDQLITHVEDRPGHDQRYAIDPTRIQTELGWKARYTFEKGIAETVAWYVDREDWWRPLLERYQYKRLGLVK